MRLCRGKPTRGRGWALGVLLVLLGTGCRQDMAKQPIGRPLSGLADSPNGGSARPLEPGTVPRGSLADSYKIRTGRRAGTDPQAFSREVFVDKMPIDVSTELVQRGRERFNIFCAECHGRLGNGNGKIPARGFTKPPSYANDLSRGFKLRGIDLPLTEVPDGYIFEVISRGFGAMADYSSQLPVSDRWAIVTYVRALQKSQKPSPGDLKRLPEEERQAFQAEQEKAK